MSDTVISVENVSKQYRLGEVGTGSLRHDFNRWWHQIRGKENPYLQVGEANDRSVKGTSDYVWSLRDINFEVKQGDVLGIMGRNGAGKSTLLKILSRVTMPTTGQLKMKGRIASLLEVGTGFNPDLTGRDNIYLNGAILGMRKREIEQKFDEIVNFSGVERYIDTPVKRYSSGMYVRLAFAVAAHLEPEILIVDEVLAVGDSEFQKKCLGKMKDVAGHGRTILFVSHNLAAMTTLCTTGLLLAKGSVRAVGTIDHCIQNYLSDQDKEKGNSLAACRLPGQKVSPRPVEFVDIRCENDNSQLSYGSRIGFALTVRAETAHRDLSIGGSIFDAAGTAIGTFFTNNIISVPMGKTTQVRVSLDLPELVPGHYSAGFSIGQGSEATKRVDYDVVVGMPKFEVIPVGQAGIVNEWGSSWGCMCLNKRVSVEMS